MAVAPIVNPVAATPLHDQSEASVDARAEAQRSELDPGKIGENLNQQFQQHTQQINGAVQQNTQAVQTQQTEIDALKNQLATATAALNAIGQQQQAPAAPPVNYDYNSEELQELGQRLPGTIDKRAAFHAGQMKDEAISAATAQATEQINALQAEINTLKQGQENITAKGQQAFRAQSMALAASSGLSITELPQDADWLAMLQEVADPISGVTYHQYLSQAVQDEDPTILGQLFQVHAGRKAAKVQNQHAASPQPQGGTPRMQADGNGETLNGLQGEIDRIYKAQTDLRQQRLGAQIGVDHFQTSMAALQTEMAGVQEKLQKFYN